MTGVRLSGIQDEPLGPILFAHGEDPHASFATPSEVQKVGSVEGLVELESPPP